MQLVGFTEAEGGILAPLFITTEVICGPEIALANVRRAIERGLPRFIPPYPAHSGSIAICGSGPSLGTTWRDIKGDVMACNSAIRFLKDRLPVKYGMLWDAHPIISEFAEPVDGCTFYVASRCDPGVFEALKDNKVIVWHATGDAGLPEMLWDIPSERDIPCVNGGSAAVTRAVYLAFNMGYRDIHLYGADSAYGRTGDGDFDTHVIPSLVKEEELKIFCGGGWYLCSPWMAAQTEEFRIVYRSMKELGANITVHGRGLLPRMWELLKEAEAGIPSTEHHFWQPA